MPGIWTSAIKQLVARTLGCAKNSAAEANPITEYPRDLIRPVKASRTSSSSSTTVIKVFVLNLTSYLLTNVALVMAVRHLSKRTDGLDLRFGRSRRSDRLLFLPCDVMICRRW